ncbi:MAG: TIGR01777 family protein [Nitrospirae bacterium]|jgi:uncharacterized protein (TIGR01777 family)|nr:TIGR01777 family protein [Nitrospirota bacterium]
MNIIVCGGNGFIGSNLVKHLLKKGHSVTILDRNKTRFTSPNLKSFQIDLLKPELFQEKWFENTDAVINLSGKDIFTFWNKEARKMIWESRVTVNKNLIDFIRKLSDKPKAFISASAVGFYGNNGENKLTEEYPHGEGFLADVCIAWEKEARMAEKYGIRSVQVRTAPVLLKNGGIMHQMMKSMRFGFTFVFGDGRQWFPWIHMQDLLRIYEDVTVNDNFSGPVNASSPNPERFKDFVKSLTKFQKALIIPLPVFLIKLFLQETADVLLFSQRVIPAKLEKNGFKFMYPNLENALKDIFSPTSAV